MTRLSELIKLAVLKAEGEEHDRTKKTEVTAKVAERKAYLLNEMMKRNININ